MRALLAVEFMKIVRRPMAWVLAVVVFGGFVLLNALFAVMIVGPETPGTDQESLRASVVLPDGFVDSLGLLGLLGSVALIILAAGVVGSEFSWGTMRTMLQVQTDRSKVLLAKILSLQIIAAALVVVSVPLSILSSWLMGIAIGEEVPSSVWLTTAFFGDIPLQAFRVFLAVGMWALIATTLTVITHSLTAGIAATLMLNFLGGTVSNLISSLGDAGTWVARVFPNEAINAVIGLNTASQEMYTRSDYPWIAASLIVWSVVLTGVALVRFRRMNILDVSA